MPNRTHRTENDTAQPGDDHQRDDQHSDDHQRDDETGHAEPEFRGAATVSGAAGEVPVTVHLRGAFQPIDGRFHWYGRIGADERVDELARANRKGILLRTADGEASGTLSDPDPWGRYRIDGIGRPPFRIEEPVEIDEPVEPQKPTAARTPAAAQAVEPDDPTA